MATVTPKERESADQFVGRLSSACKRAGLLVEVIEPSTRLKISTPNGSDFMAETITLKADADGALMWWWSWDTPLCHADDIGFAVKAIMHVVTETRA